MLEDKMNTYIIFFSLLDGLESKCVELSVAYDGLPKRFGETVEFQFHVHVPRAGRTDTGAREVHARQERTSWLVEDFADRSLYIKRFLYTNVK